MFSYTFYNKSGSVITFRRNSKNIVIPSNGSYTIIVGDSCPIPYKVYLHKIKKIHTSSKDLIMTLREVHTKLNGIVYDYKVEGPKVETPKEPEPSKSEEVIKEIPEVAEKVSVVEELPKKEPEKTISEELASFKVIEFNPIMYVGKPEKILVKTDGDGRSINFKSSDKKVALVTRFGNVYPQAPGYTDISITFNGVTKVLKLEVIADEGEDPEEE